MAKRTTENQPTLGDAAMSADDMRGALVDDAASAEELDAAGVGEPGEPEPQPTRAIQRSNGTTTPTTDGPLANETLGRLWQIPPSLVSDTIAKCITPTDSTPVGKHHIMQATVLASYYRLNPLLRQIYFWIDKKDPSKVVACIGLDGWFLIAARSNKVMGLNYEIIDDENGNPVKCIVTGWLRGCPEPFTHTEWVNECRGSHLTWNTKLRRRFSGKTTVEWMRRYLGISIGPAVDPDDYEEIEVVPSRAADIDNRINAIQS